jgi:hypothetical protein
MGRPSTEVPTTRQFSVFAATEGSGDLVGALTSSCDVAPQATRIAQQSKVFQRVTTVLDNGFDILKP